MDHSGRGSSRSDHHRNDGFGEREKEVQTMKKFRLILALLTIVSGIYMIYANVSVSGYRLLTMNSAAGHLSELRVCPW